MQLHRHLLPLALALTAAVCPPGAAQTVVGPILIHSTPHASDYGETSVNISATNPYEAMVAFNAGPTGVHVSCTLNGFGTPAAPSFAESAFQGPDCVSQRTSVDPIVCASPPGSPNAGHMWVSALMGGVTAFGDLGLSVVHKAPGALAPDWAAGGAVIWCPPEPFHLWADKPFSVVGPAHVDPSLETMYCLNSEIRIGSCPGTLWGKRSLPSGLPGSSWNTAESAFLPVRTDTSQPCGTLGLGISAVVVPSHLPANPGPTAGRVVAAWQSGNGNGDVPSTAYSDDEVATWRGGPTPPFPFVRLNSANGVGLLRGITDADFSVQLNGGSSRNFPGIAIDARDPNRVLVYLVYLAVPDGATDGNVEIVIAQGITDQQGVIQWSSDQTLLLTDAMLGELPGTDEYLPWIATDPFGGIHIVYYAIYNLEIDAYVTVCRAKYAYIANFAVPLTSNPVVRTSAPEFGLLARPGDNQLGDYNSIAFRKCYGYASFASRHQGPQNVYVCRITICPADVDGNGDVDSADAVAFAGAFIAGSPPADVNQDQTIDIQDVVYFQTCLTCGCGTPSP